MTTNSSLDELSSDLLGLYDAGANADVPFVFPDGEIKAHKLILTTRVPYFEKMFASGMKEALTNRVEVPDMEKETFDLFFRFIYGGQLPQDLKMPNDVESLLMFASKYDHLGLLNSCLQKLEEYLSSLSSVNAGIDEVARMMETSQVADVKRTMQNWLTQQIDRSLASDGPVQPGEIPLPARIVKLLILSHKENWDYLKKMCLLLITFSVKRGLGCFRPQFEEAAEKLQEHPKLLLDLVLCLSDKSPVDH